MTTNNIKVSEEFKEYEKLFKKYNLFLSDFNTLENYTITMTENRYEKQGRKNFPQKPTTTKTENITVRQYACYMSSIDFFNDRVEKTYTSFGYKPYRLTCKNPSNDLKIERIFDFKYNR